jgi:flagellar biosynthetic protein FliR
VTSYALTQLLPANIFVILLVMCRVGAALTLLPGFSATYVPMQFKALLTVLLGALVAPTLANDMPPMPTEVRGLVGMIGIELLVGAFIGLYVNLLMSALDIAGTVIAMQSSLTSAIVFNPGEMKQETLPASLLSTTATVLIFVTNMHYLFIGSIVDSYHRFPAGGALPMEDLSDAIARIVSQGFMISIQLAAPYIVLGTTFYVALGLIGRVMPQLQIFYVGLPLQVFGGLAMLLITVPAGLLWFLGKLQESVTNLAGLF